MLSASLLACGMDKSLAEQSLSRRIANREFPSVFQAWARADNLEEDPVVTAVRHDLIFHGARFFGLEWNNTYPGLATGFTPGSIQAGLERRRDLLRRNANLILLLEIRYRDARNTFLPEDHEWWRRDGDGKIVPGWEEGGFLQMDFSNPRYREHVAVQAQAAVECGVLDGVMLDWWVDDSERLELVKAIRRRIGDDALVIVNSNDRQIPRTASLVNGLFMECCRSKTPEDWKRIAETLAWAEKHLREPRINCLETWYHTSRADESLMRATTALALALSDGYCLFSDPNPLPTPDHLHDWYPFWDRHLGRPLASGMVRPDGSIIREFSKGTVVYNPMGNAPVTVAFDEERTSRASGTVAHRHTVDPCDGDLFLKPCVLHD